MSDARAAAYLRQNPGFEQASTTDPFEATAQTVRYMCRLVSHSLSDPIVMAACSDALSRFQSLAGATPEKLWWWAKLSIKFVHHQKLLERWLQKSDELQLLISPEALLKMQQPKGDCAVFTTLICALLQCAGIGWEIVTVAVDPRSPGIFSHVYPRAVLQNGTRLPLDASHGKYPGWEVPAQRVTAKQIWDSQGNPIQDQDRGTFRGLHGVPSMRRGFGCCGGYEGLGQDDTDFSALETPVVDPNASAELSWETSQLNPYAGLTTPTVVNPPSTGGAPTSSSGSSALGTEISSLLNAWTKIGGQVVAPTTTVCNSAGVCSQTPASSGTSLLSTSTISSYLPILLLAGGLIFAISAMKK